MHSFFRTGVLVFFYNFRYEISSAIASHKHKFIELYADVSDTNTDNSVDRLHTIHEETYLCPAEVDYVRILRAINTQKQWKVIINNIKIDYDEFTQTSRLEECTTAGQYCPLVPDCYQSKCIQKNIIHRFVVWDPYDSYFPFAIDTFELPGSCACHVADYYLEH